MDYSAPSFRIVIPTRDSSRWIGSFLGAYRKVGLDPLYIVDARSEDATVDILRKMGADLLLFTPPADIVEAGMIEFGAKAAGAPWVFRIDDDEFPSTALLHWIPAALAGTACSAFEISRRDITRRDGKYCYSRWPTRWILADFQKFLPNPQTRLFHVDRVDFIQRVHTCGFAPRGAVGMAPKDCFLVHSNNLLRSPAERLAKLRVYACYDELSAWKFADECLPELTDAAMHAFASDGLEEFKELFESLPAPKDASVPALTAEEQEIMSRTMQEWLEEAFAARRNYEAQLGLRSRWFPYVPRSLLKPLSKLLRALPSDSLRRNGVRLSNYSRHLAGGTCYEE